MNIRFMAVILALVSLSAVAGSSLVGNLIGTARFNQDAQLCTYAVAYKNTHVQVNQVKSVCTVESAVAESEAEQAYKNGQ